MHTRARTLDIFSSHISSAIVVVWIIISIAYKNFSELFFPLVVVVSWLDIDKDELEVVFVVVAGNFSLPLGWSEGAAAEVGGGCVTACLLVAAPDAAGPPAAWAKCQLVSSWDTKWRSRSKYWLYNSTSLWPAPFKRKRKFTVDSWKLQPRKGLTFLY